MAAYRNYPTLMLLHLRRNFPTFGFERYRFEQRGERGRREMDRFDERVRAEWKLRCLMMSAYQTAGPAIEVSRSLSYDSYVPSVLMTCDFVGDKRKKGGTVDRGAL